MTRVQTDAYVKERHILDDIPSDVGIYAILIDNYVAYIGAANDMKDQCTRVIQDILNAHMGHVKKKNRLLASAIYGGHKVQFMVLHNGDTKNKDFFLEEVRPPLNSIYKDRRINIDNLTIEQLIASLRCPIQMAQTIAPIYKTDIIDF